MSGRTKIDASSTPRLARHARLRHDEKRGRWLINAPERVLMLDDIAAEILRRVDGEASVETITGALAEAFGAPVEEVGRDVVEMLQDLADKGFVEA